jgi:hypothetical protein
MSWNAGGKLHRCFCFEYHARISDSGFCHDRARLEGILSLTPNSLLPRLTSYQTTTIGRATPLAEALEEMPGVAAVELPLAAMTLGVVAEEEEETMLAEAEAAVVPVACKCRLLHRCTVLMLSSCNQEGHFARECPDKPEGGGLTGECFNCGEVGHNKADCTNPRVERAFTGTCNLCGEEGHPARSCPKNPQECRLCKQQGHKAIDCKERRMIDWTGIPELEAAEAWTALVDAAKSKDLDMFRTALKAYARSTNEDFSLQGVEGALREDNLPVYLIAMTQEIEKNMTIVDMIGSPGREFILTIQLSDKPRRKKMAEGWPESAEVNMTRLASAGFVQDIGVPLCGNCGGKSKHVYSIHSPLANSYFHRTRSH